MKNLPGQVFENLTFKFHITPEHTQDKRRRKKIQRRKKTNEIKIF